MKAHKHHFLALVVLLFMTTTVPAQCPQRNDAFAAGEILTYNLYYNWKFVWVKAGTASMSTIKSKYKGRDAWRTSLITRGNKKADGMFVLRDTLLSYSTLDMVPLYFRKGAREGKRYNVDEVNYSYSGGKCNVHMTRKHTDGSVTGSKKSLDGCVYDMINIFMRSRSFDPSSWKQGHVINFKMADGKELSTARLVYKGKTTVKGDNNRKYRCLILSYMELSKGKYKEVVRFFVSDDQNHVPIRIDLFLRFGSAKAYLLGMSGLRHPVSAEVN